jgi:hypothetical protein
MELQWLVSPISVNFDGIHGKEHRILKQASEKIALTFA